MAKETVLVLGAHNDDPIFGAGGTLAKYAKQGHRIKTVIFSYGEMSHPHLKPEIIKKQRYKESIAADKVIGGRGVQYLGVKDGMFLLEFSNKKIKKKIKDIIKKEKPSKIFTHGINDHHQDHFAVYKLMQEIISEMKLKCDIYSFDVWNIIKIFKRNRPRLIVDVTKTFDTKIRAIKAHKSQINTMVSIGWTVYLKAILNGRNNNCKYAEIFDKIN